MQGLTAKTSGRWRRLPGSKADMAHLGICGGCFAKGLVTAAVIIAPLTACAEAVSPDPDPGPANASEVIDPIEPLAGASAASFGHWSTSTLDGKSALVYSWGATPEIVFSCDGRRGINVELRGQTPVPPLEMIRITTDGETRLYAARPLGNRTVRAAIPAADVMIGALRQAKPIRLTFGDDEVITTSASPLVPTFVNRCRAP